MLVFFQLAFLSNALCETPGQPGISGEAGPLPVLPFPQVVKQGTAPVTFGAEVAFRGIGLATGQLERLKKHWAGFRPEFPRQNAGKKKEITVELRLLQPGASERLLQTGRAFSDSLGTEGYVLDFSTDHPFIAAFSETGLFYGLQTLRQLTRAGWKTGLFIADWPVFPTRVIYDDISRGPISTPEYVRAQIRRLAELKINYLSFYIEHVVQPLSHPDFAPENGKLTIAQIRELSAYAEKYHMKLIGSFQSFGHFEKILSLPQYKSMGETANLISPLDPKARKFLENVIGELCDAFNAPWFNVNCDETFDLNKGKSKAYIDSIGPDRFYADHLKFLHDVVTRHGKKMMVWGDIVIQHETVADMLPRDIVYLTWEYGDQKSYDQWIRPFASRGLEYMVCPGVLNSYRMFPDMVMAKGNIKGFLEAGRKQGATGAFTTLWDDGGTYLFSGDWYGVYQAAEKSWNLAHLPERSFDSRYGLTAYGTADDNYVKALFRLMELRRLTLTYNLNDQIWLQKLLSDPGKPLLLNNSSVPQARQILADAAALAGRAKAVRNNADLAALQFSIDQYALIMDLRTTLPEVALTYRKAGKAGNPGDAVKLLQASETAVAGLTDRLEKLKTRFETAWMQENQEYWLDVVTAGYEAKLIPLRNLQASLVKARETRQLPDPGAIGLDISETPYTYFQYWLLAGPYPVEKAGGLPSFLYSENPEYDHPPIPGGISIFKGKDYRWRKFGSTDGGAIDLEHYYGKKEVAAYAYCTLKANDADIANLYVSGPAGTEVFCNGKKIGTLAAAAAIGNPQQVPVALKKGATGQLLLKIPWQPGQPWRYSVRLDGETEVINHKHKYQTNSKNKSYEAE
ncbi:hypothetical protein GCM10023091_03520 [Ravibacter arvi]|uniref:beta-N-acetylhexosaminidase n=1 Tax=Ravibacter arvi TaxID=2051041 RepID=A0ABP8LPL2_9BACT